MVVAVVVIMEGVVISRVEISLIVGIVVVMASVVMIALVVASFSVVDIVVDAFSVVTADVVVVFHYNFLLRLNRMHNN